MKKILAFIQLFIVFNGFSQDSLDIKIGQMIMVGIKDYYDRVERTAFLESVSAGKVGGIILYEKNLLPVNTAAEIAAMNLEIIEASTILPFISIDEEGGLVNRLKPKYGFPRTKSASQITKLDNPDSSRYYAEQTASLLQTLGFNLNYAPVVDVNINPANPVIGKLGRSYGSDYRVVIREAEIYLKAHQKYHVGTTLKHFPGHGSSATDTHLGMADVSDSWEIEELFPYKALIDSGLVNGIMTAHIVNSRLDNQRLPATLSSKIIQGLLREFLGYQGVVFSDDMHMGAISEHYGFEEAVVLAINAGVDVLMFSNNVFDYQLTSADELHALIRLKVKEGAIREETIDAAYQRIVALKRKLGLFDEEYLKETKRKLKKLN